MITPDDWRTDVADEDWRTRDDSAGAPAATPQKVPLPLLMTVGL